MTPADVRWVVDARLASAAWRTGGPNLPEALEAMGCEVVVAARGAKGLACDGLPWWAGQCVVAWGSVPFVREAVRSRGGYWLPGAFMAEGRLSVSGASAGIGDLMLNADYVLLPLTELSRRGLSSWGGRAFVRPDAVDKAFPGRVLDDRSLEAALGDGGEMSALPGSTLVAIAVPREILGEFRFVVARREVAAGSAYRWDGRVDVRSDVHPAALELAREVAGREWQADLAYVCDVAVLPDGSARVVELNAFSCAGLYACDTAAVARAVSLAAIEAHPSARPFPRLASGG